MANCEKIKEIRILLGETISKFNQNQWNEFLNKMGPHPLSTVPFWKRINRIRKSQQSQNVGTLIRSLTVLGLKKTQN